MAKRSACDRCRAKRIRCPRAGNSRDPCARCVRAGAECATGQPGLLGRPRKTFLGHSDRLPAQNPTRGSDSPALRGGVQERRQPAPVPSNGSKIAEAPAARPMAEKDTTFYYGHYVPGSAFGVIGNSYSAAPAPWDMPVLFQAPLEACASPGQAPPFMDFDSAGGHIDHGTLVNTTPECRVDGEPIEAGDLETPYGGADQRCSALIHTSPSEATLSPLNEKISTAISASETFPCTQPGLIERCKECIETIEKNTIVLAMRYTEEFTKVLRGLNARQPSNHERHAQTKAPSARVDPADQPRPPGMATILSILSTYVRLLELYDIIFRNFAHTVISIPYETIASTRIKSVFRIEGLPSMHGMPGHLYAQTLVYVFRNHIEAMELEMGFPTQFCIYPQETPTGGIFTSDDLTSLLTQVMGHAEVGSPKGAIRFIESLRVNMQKTEDALRGVSTK